MEAYQRDFDKRKLLAKPLGIGKHVELNRLFLIQKPHCVVIIVLVRFLKVLLRLLRVPTYLV